MKTIVKYVTVASPFKKGTSACYHARPIQNVTKTLDDLAADAAKRNGLDCSLVKFVASILMEQVRKAFADGLRVDLGDVIGELTIRGSFPSKDGVWDSSVNKFVPKFHARGELLKSVEDLVPQNVVEAVTVQIKRVVDAKHKTENELVSVPNLDIVLTGMNLQTSTDASSGEGCWLEDCKTEEVVARGEVVQSTLTSLDAQFATMPPPGNYNFVLATRNGMPSECGPYITRRRVKVVSGKQGGR